MRLLYFGILAAVSGAGADLSFDAERGEELFRTYGCVECHSVRGVGGRSAPDLGRRTSRDYTPAIMASLMWNHAPAMWEAMRGRGVAPPPVDEAGAADLFAFFYAVRFFDKPGDAARGKRLFASRGCAGCHAISGGGGPGRPVADWQSLADPIELVRQMWNHAEPMRAAIAQKKLKWVRLTRQELSDILVYLQNLPETRGKSATLRLPATPAESGAELLKSKGCLRCHTGGLSLERRERSETLTDLAVAMWNHGRQMHPLQLASGEMQAMVRYIWARRFFQARGSVVRGRRVFTGRGCAVCHEDRSSGAPALGGREHSPISMVASLWRHGPAMLERMRERGVPWPRFSEGEMGDLIAYLNSQL